MTPSGGVRRRAARLLVVVAALTPALWPVAADAQAGSQQPDGTVLANRDILDCPIRQRPVRNGPHRGPS